MIQLPSLEVLFLIMGEPHTINSKELKTYWTGVISRMTFRYQNMKEGLPERIEWEEWNKKRLDELRGELCQKSALGLVRKVPNVLFVRHVLIH